MINNLSTIITHFSCFRSCGCKKLNQDIAHKGAIKERLKDTFISLSYNLTRGFCCVITDSYSLTLYIFLLLFKHINITH